MGGTKRCISDERLSATGFSYTLSLISGKYKMTILYTLMEFGVVRFNEMKKYIGGISYKTLSATLKELEGGPAGPPGGVPPDPAQGGVQPDGAGAVTDPHSGRHVRVGGTRTGCRGKPAGIRKDAGRLCAIHRVGQGTPYDLRR